MSELVIGARRPGQHRRLRSVGVAAVLVCLGGLVAYLIYGRVVSYNEPSGQVPDGPVRARLAGGGQPAALGWGDCALEYAGSLRILRLVGKPHTLGACHGRLLAGEVAQVTDTLTATLAGTVPDGGLFAGLLHGTRLRWRYRLLDEAMGGAYLSEAAGQVHGAERAGDAPEFEEHVRAQAALDVGRASAATPGAHYRAIGRALSFAVMGKPATGSGSASGSGTAGAIVIGRVFSLLGAADGGDAAGRATVVSFVRGEGTIAYASVGWPGLVGVVTGQNAEGIAILVHPAAASDVRQTRAAQPVALIARQVLEHAHTLAEAITIVEKTVPLGAAGFLIVDGRRGEIAWIERSPGRSHVTRAPAPPVASDYFTTQPFLDDPDNDRSRRTRPSVARMARAAELSRRAPAATAAEVVTILRDSAAVGGAPLPPGHRGAIDDPEAVHVVVLDPVGGFLWVAEGRGAAGRFHGFDVARELGGATGAPPGDIPADAARDPAVVDQVVRARRDLRAARAARTDEGVGRARELADRAVARRPDLPEALLLAGELARSDGDATAARDAFERYLATGADDPAAEEQVRAQLRER